MFDAINPLSGDGKQGPKFQVYKNKSDSDYHWRLVAANGEELALSEPYKTKDGALKGVESLRRNASEADVVELDEPPVRERRSK